MADNNADYEDSDSSEEVENPDQQSGKTKKKWKRRAQEYLKRKMNIASDDQNPKKDAAKGKGPRKRSSDGSTSDTSNPREMPPIEEEKKYLYQTQPVTESPVHPVPGYAYQHGPNSATILTQPRLSSATSGSAHSSARPGYDHLPQISPAQVRSFTR